MYHIKADNPVGMKYDLHLDTSVGAAKQLAHIIARGAFNITINGKSYTPKEA